MRAASVKEIRDELMTLKPAELAAICQRLARFKKENKELLTYLLFEAHDEASYINEVKAEVEELFREINLSHLYFVKKSLRKILRVINKHVRYMASKQAEVELLLHICQLVTDAGIPIKKNKVLANIYYAQLKKLSAAITGLHEDLQYEYQRQFEKLAG